MVLAGFLFAPASAPGAANYPFPQNQAQPNAVLYPSYSNADVVKQYNAWVAEQVTTSGAGPGGGSGIIGGVTQYQRVQRNGDPTLTPFSTVSEGIGYGMIITVYMNQQQLFNNLWAYEQLYAGGDGLMNWYIGPTGAVEGSGPATDADEDMAWALVMAHYQWGDSSSALNYTSLATAQINAIYAHEINAATSDVLPGDGWGQGSLNPSYFDPAEYRVFAQFTGNNGWLGVVNECYTVLFNSLNAASGNQSNGLDPAWCTPAGVPTTAAFTGAPDWYQYDACRTPFRVLKDWVFFGEPRALSYTALNNAFFVPIGAAGIIDGYNLDGSPHPLYDTAGNTGQAASFVGPATCAAMPNPADAAFVQAGYDLLTTAQWQPSNLASPMLIGGQYYDQSWDVMSLLMMSGNYLDYAPLPPTPTPSPTPDACQARIRVDAGASTPYVSSASGLTWAADRLYAAGGYGYVSWAAGTATSSAGPVTNTNDPTLYLTERYGPTVGYDFTVPNGPATVTFYWAETYFSTAGQRVFSVSINGAPVETNLDLYTAAGGKNVAYVASFPVTVTTGLISILMTASANNATIQAISVQAGPLCTPTVTATATPAWTRTDSPTASPSPSQSPTFSASPTASVTPTVSPTFTAWPTPDACTLVDRIDCAASAAYHSGSSGLTWAADQTFTAGSYGTLTWAAGTATSSAGPVTNTNDPTLYLTERYGSQVGYAFTVPNGPALVTFCWAETYHTGPGQRVFSVNINGSVVEPALDIFAAAGGKNVALVQTFPVAVTNGLVTVLLTASVDNATVQAIAVQSGDGCTRTVTPTFTAGTLSSTVTPSIPPTASPSATLSLTRTGTFSPSPSATRSASPSATPSASPSSTPSLSPSATPSPSPSATASLGLSASPSQSPSPTPSLTRTQGSGASPSPSQSPSLSATGVTPGTPSASATITATPTPPALASPTPSATASPSPDGSPTLSGSPTPAITPVGSGTQTPSISVTATPGATASAQPSATQSPAQSPTQSPTFSATFSATQSAVPSVPLTATQSPTPSMTPGSPLPSLTASPGPGLTATGTLAPALSPESSGPPVILKAVFEPCPFPGSGSLVLAMDLSAPADSVEWRCYNRAFVCVARGSLGFCPAGWSQTPLGSAEPGWQGGLYFVALKAKKGSAAAPGRTVKLWVQKG